MHGAIGSLSKGGGAWCNRVIVLQRVVAVHGVIGSLSKGGGAWCNRVIV